MDRVTRRSFIQKSLATAATITIAGTKSAPRVLGANERIRIAVAGLNGRGHSHTDAYLGMKNVEGADAPKARSWKSGFLKKGTARIEVMDASNRLKLSDHVGERVSISGMLADRELQGRSLRRVASSCE